MDLRSLKLPGGRLIAWSDRSWVQLILPSDSWKKRIFRFLLRLPFAPLVSRSFEGEVFIKGRVLDLKMLLPMLADVVADPVVEAVFVNSQRKPPRIYIWLKSKDGPKFMKIGTNLESQAFKNEFELVKSLDVHSGVRVMRPLKLFQYKEFEIIVFEGLDKSDHAKKCRLFPRELISYFVAHELKGAGFFGGPVHGDLSSNNAFKLGGQVLIFDWEFGSASGPEYCDLIELALSLALSNARLPKRDLLRSIKLEILELSGVRLSEATIHKALVFLATKGNSNAENYMAGKYQIKFGAL